MTTACSPDAGRGRSPRPALRPPDRPRADRRGRGRRPARPRRRGFPAAIKLARGRRAPAPGRRRQRHRGRADERQGPRCCSRARRTSCSTAPSWPPRAVGAREVLAGGARRARTASSAAALAAARRRRDRCVTLVAARRRLRRRRGDRRARRTSRAGRARPRVTPPRPAERGLRGRPTLVQNVETLAHLGADRAPRRRLVPRGRDRASARARRCVTVSGAVRAPGVYEVDRGHRARRDRALRRPTEPLRALLVGGYFGAWVPAERAGLALDDAALRPHGAASAPASSSRSASALPGRRDRPARRLPGRASRPASAARASTASARWPTSSSASPTGRTAPGDGERASCAGSRWSAAAAPARTPTASRAHARQRDPRVPRASSSARPRGPCARCARRRPAPRTPLRWRHEPARRAGERARARPDRLRRARPVRRAAARSASCSTTGAIRSSTRRGAGRAARARAARGQGLPGAGAQAQANAPTPVMSRPTISVCMVSVPS